MGNNPLSSASEITQFEYQIGYTLPDDYRVFMFDFNGGKVGIDHSIDFELGGDVLHGGVDAMYPLIKQPKWSVAILETRKIQEIERMDTRSLLRIGDDGGTGFYYLSLSGGGIYFCYKDDIECGRSDWENADAGDLEYMVKMSDSFSGFGWKIWNGKR